MKEYSVNTSINMPITLLVKIDKIADDTGRTRSAIINNIMEEYFKNEGK